MKRLLFIFQVLFMSCLLFAEGSESVISSINFQGLKKTKESYMQDLLKSYIGKDASEKTQKDVETVLQAEGLFSEIEVSFSSEENEETPAETVMNVSLKEKITFIPLPFASYSSDGFMGGFMLLNMNAFGKKYNLITGGVFTPEMQMGMLIFSKPAMDISHPGLSNYTSFCSTKTTITDFDDHTLDEFKNLQLRERFAFNEKFNNWLSLDAGADYFYAHIFKDDRKDFHQWLAYSTLTLQTVDWNGWYLISKSVSLTGEAGCSTDWEAIQKESFVANYQIPVFERNRIVFNLAGAIETGKNVMKAADRDDGGCTVMNSGFKTDRILGSMVSFEEALFRKSFATLSLYETYEAAITKDYDGTFEYCHGPGMGLKLYMKQVAFPAMNMGFSYNVNQNFFKFVIAIGMGM